jgi:hypothetical protein
MRLLESLGLGLLLTSVVIGLSSLWLHSAAGQSLVQRFPRLAAVLYARALMLLVMISGVCLLVLSLVMTPAAVPSTAPLGRNNLPHQQVPPETAGLPTVALPASAVPAPVAAPASTPASVPLGVPPEKSATSEKSRDPLPLSETPAKPAPTLRQALPQAAPVSDARRDAPESVPQKRNIFSARCARLVEKVGAGEPMTPQEQHEMVTQCQ